MEDHDYVIKTLLVGDSGVGKTSIFMRYCTNYYNSGHEITVGVDFQTKSIIVGKSKVKLHIWDTAGQEKFRSIITSYYRNAHAVMLVFDMTNFYSFISLEYWINQISSNIANSNYKIILVGNKCELTSKINVTDDMIKSFTDKYHIDFYPVSAKSDINIDYAFNTLSSRVISTMAPNRVETEHTKKKGKCCSN